MDGPFRLAVGVVQLPKHWDPSTSKCETFCPNVKLELKNPTSLHSEHVVDVKDPLLKLLTTLHYT